MSDHSNEMLLLQIKDIVRELQESRHFLLDAMAEDFEKLEKRISKLETIVSKTLTY